MPTYDYECQACQHTFEKYQEITAKKLRTCPICAKKKLHRLIGAGAGVIFRGSGFYETDYKRASRGGKSRSDDASESSTSTKTETSTKAETSKATSGTSGDASKSGSSKGSASNGGSSRGRAKK